MEWHPAPIERRKSRQIKVGNVLIGGNAPISVQSMTSTDTMDVDATVNQIKALKNLANTLFCPLIASDNVASASISQFQKVGSAQD